MTLPLDAYPAYARSERIADGSLHLLGVVLAVAGAVALWVWGVPRTSGADTLALIVYGLALIATFAASACYHMTPWTRYRAILRRLDHAAIYLKIAGTFTPLAVLVGSGLTLAVLAVVWMLALWGIVRKVFFWQVPGRFGPALYLGMGWLGVLLVPGIATLLPATALGLLATGGLLYSAGVIFFWWDGLKFSNAIWHGFVLAASCCFFAGIWIAVATLT
ncbi:hemolysin III [Loktanella fryxellensis]|uniref:Hemolysin III n=1 Tax=Loktanella fryxellensis TaxID=245187 RepID=A0A1H8ETD6_9RHOB|nr:hemolysin III family protein [Loktanella fryxellensis]SEN22743.1 hemolysin III [Loktanella fryxellensis]